MRPWLNISKHLFLFLVYFSLSSISVHSSLHHPQCSANPPNLSSATGIGSVETIGGLKTYVTGSTHRCKRAILLVSDIFGYEAPNLRKLADKVAAAGFYVVVPDFLYGDPYLPDNAERPLPEWLKSHGPGKPTADSKLVIAALKSKGMSAIGAAGFCWGGKIAVELAKCDKIKAAVLLHPSSVTIDDIKEVKKPLAVLGAEIDKASPPELMKQFEKILSAKPEIDSLVKIFAGCQHGWTLRYNDKDEAAVKSAEEAHQNMIDWFLKYVR